MKRKNKVKVLLSALLSAAILISVSVTGVNGAADEGRDRVILGGMPFGVSFVAGELSICGFDDIETEGGVCSPARDAGLMVEDIILKVDGRVPKTALDVTEAVRSGGGAPMSFEIKRGEKTLSIGVTPKKALKTGDFRLGMWLDDSCAGLGTVTYIEERTGEFGGLGHGICDSKTGELCSFERGVVSEVRISGVTKGKVGEPGELRGDFQPFKLGAILKNTDEGVFGVLTSLPEGCSERLIEVGTREDIKSGGASIYCTADTEGVCEYGVEITLIEEGEGDRDFVVTVTDTTLIEKTGGIVRGMSGSPVVQDGKLVGAVTHVLVGDPTKGYGIFIENMLSSAA